MVTNFPAGKSLTSKLLSWVKTSPGVQHASARDRNIPRVADISSAAAVPFPETSANTNPQRPSANGMKSYQSPPTAPAGMLRPDTAKPVYVRRALRQKRLLNGAGFLSFAVHSFARGAFRLESPRVMRLPPRCDRTGPARFSVAAGERRPNRDATR